MVARQAPLHGVPPSFGPLAEVVFGNADSDPKAQNSVACLPSRSFKNTVKRWLRR
jgi:hypothetical protein